MYEIGYCPWCGVAIAPMDIFASTGDIEWNHCHTWGCKGTRLVIITDKAGFVIHPYHIRGNYIYVKPAYKTKDTK
jgi:hypothetical protein